MRAERIRFRRLALIRAIGLQAPALLIVPEVGGHDLVQYLLMNSRVLDGYQRFNAPVDVAGHPVRRRDIYLGVLGGQFVAVAETGNAGMLEKPADDGSYLNILAQTWDAGSEATYPPGHDFDLDAGLRGRIQGIDHLGVDQRIDLDPDARRPPGFGVFDLVVDLLHQEFAHGQWGDDHFFQVHRFGIAGHIIEDLQDIVADLGVTGEK